MRSLESIKWIIGEEREKRRKGEREGRGEPKSQSAGAERQRGRQREGGSRGCNWYVL